MTDSPVFAPDVALVCEGGGTRNSFTAASIHELMRREVSFGWVGGISAGATHTANFLAGDADRARESFGEFIVSKEAGGIRSFLGGDGYFNAEYIYELSGQPESALPYDWDAYHANPTPFRVGGMNAVTGETVYWGREDIDDLPSLMKRVRASSTLPVIMNMTEIDGVEYVDGALGSSAGIPVEAAEADGFEKFLVLCTHTRGYVRPEVKYPGAVRRLLRNYPTVAEAVISRPARYNAEKERLLQMEKEGRAYLFFPDEMRIGNTERDLDKLKAAYYDGMVQTHREWDRWMEFLGV
ncbi:patatin-like phospholipase family protein [Corynebacterium terpenotabidum]|uniref:Putative phospholipase n=1 Tax=Corynebacterium terpenotabidum Y-11 TaxID=1200352 RepID=S4XBG1_9CORY|nr:DUF6363 domain-containing protein [Corynebacterium terpenotabidum]AGP29931.1 putative phospholipase [Corynebacterium terpenotabidum Y-11]